MRLMLQRLAPARMPLETPSWKGTQGLHASYDFPLKQLSKSRFNRDRALFADTCPAYKGLFHRSLELESGECAVPVEIVQIFCSQSPASVRINNDQVGIATRVNGTFPRIKPKNSGWIGRYHFGQQGECKTSLVNPFCQ